MKQAQMLYVSPLQTQLHSLRQLLVRCERFGLAVERSTERILNYRIVNGEDVLTEFTTLAKLELWMQGFVAGAEHKQKQDNNDD